MVKNKKGIGDAIDWIVAVSIFLIYFGLVFVFFKPGGSETFQPDTLLNLVEEEFVKNVSWSMRKIPLFIGGPNGQISNFKFDSDFEGELGLEPGEHWIIDTLPADIEEASNRGRESLAREVGAEHQGDPPSFSSSGRRGKLRIIVSKEDIGTIETRSGAQEICNIKDRDETDPLASGRCWGYYTIGASEQLKGISLEKFNTLKADYEKAKTDWSFPAVKDFRVIVYSNVGGVEFAEAEEGNEWSFGVEVPPISEEVYVREFNTFRLYGDGSKVPVTVNIRVW